jgi:hypothetical protein
MWPTPVTPLSQYLKIGAARSCFGVDHYVREVPGLVGTFLLVGDGKGHTPALGPPRGAPVGVTVNQECRSEALEIGGEMHRGGRLSCASFVAGNRDKHAHAPLLMEWHNREIL